MSSANPGEPQSYCSFSRVTSRVRPPWTEVSCHDQVLCGLAHSSHWWGSNALTLNAVVWLALLESSGPEGLLASWVHEPSLPGGSGAGAQAVGDL